MTLDDLDRLFGLMAKHGVVAITHEGTTIQRPLIPVSAEADKKESEVDRLKRMTPETQDRVLMLQRLPRGS